MHAKSSCKSLLPHLQAGVEGVEGGEGLEGAERLGKGPKPYMHEERMESVVRMS